MARAARTLRVEPLEDRITPVVVSSLNPSLSGGTLPAAATSIQVNYSAAVIGGATASNFELRGIGSDGLLGTADDVLVSLGASYAGTTTTLTFTTLPSNSVANVWRLTVKSTVTDANGVALDGDANGNPGGNFVRDFVGEPTPYLTLNSQGGRAFDVQTGGYGAGQLLQGGVDAFDGVNRLNFGGVDYQPATTTVAGTTPAVTSVVSGQMVTADSAYHTLSGYSVSFASDGSSAVRVGAVLQVTNFGGDAGISSYQLLLDGTPVGLQRYTELKSGYYAQMVLDEVLTGVSAGSHTLTVQALAYQPLRVDVGTVSAYLLKSIPFVGAGTIPTVTTVASSQMVAADSTYHTLPGYSVDFTTDGSAAIRVGAALQVTNFGGDAAISSYRLLIDGTPVGLQRYTELRSGYYSQLMLDEVLPVVAAGTHTLTVQALAYQSLRIDTGTVSAFVHPRIPQVGFGTELSTVSIDSSQMVVADNTMHTLSGYSVGFISDGSPLHVSTLLQVTNFGAEGGDSYYRLLLDGAPIGLTRYTQLSAGYYAQMVLDEVLTGLSSGAHTIQIQAQSPHLLRIDVGSLVASQFHSFPNPTLANGGRTLVTPSQTIGGLVVSREITVPSVGSQDFARTIEVITNPTAGTITTPVRITGNLGSNQAVFATQNGNLVAEPMDQWIGTDDADGTGSPAVVHIIRGPAGLRPSAVSTNGDNIAWTYSVTLAPGETVRLVSFTVLAPTRAAAVAAARAINTPAGFGGEADAFLSQAQLDTIANFQAPAVAPSDALVVGGGSQSAAAGTPNATGQYGSLVGATGGLSGVVRTASADVNGDEIPDAILVTGPGQPIRVVVVSGADNSAVLVAPFDPFGGDFLGGGFVAAADLDGDGRAEFAVTPDRGGGPRVSIYSLNPNASVTTRANFFGIDDPNFRGGARAALGDIDADGTPELLVAAGFGGGPRVAVFRGTTLFTTRGKLVSDFFAFPEDADTLRNGVFAAVGDISGDGFADLVFGGGPGGGPRVYILSGQLLVNGSPNLFSQPVANFFVAGNGADRGGVRLAVKNADGDAKADLIAGSGEGSPANVRIYLGKNFTGTGEPGGFQDLSAFGGAVLNEGVFVG